MLAFSQSLVITNVRYAPTSRQPVYIVVFTVEDAIHNALCPDSSIYSEIVINRKAMT